VATDPLALSAVELTAALRAREVTAAQLAEDVAALFASGPDQD